MNKQSTNKKIDEIVFFHDPRDAIAETIRIVSQFSDNLEKDLFVHAIEDVKLLFKGRYSGYRASNTQYHDFEHTVSVALATARLLHGYYVDGHNYTSKDAFLTLMAALFHDLGFIQEKNDIKGTGAKYTVGHEERSILFLKNYLADKHLANNEIETCSNFIRCTIQSFSPHLLPFSSKELRLLGCIVGSADLLAQMADRYYLEKLLLLYKEFEEARLQGFDSELELLKKTKYFYEFVAKKRLTGDLEGLWVHMRSHFKNWMGIDRDFYSESIRKNIEYLESVVSTCNDSLICYLEKLRRGGISKKIIDMIIKGR